LSQQSVQRFPVQQMAIHDDGIDLPRVANLVQRVCIQQLNICDLAFLDRS
jgi:hypothetical protein